jgi:hypothetical protein
LQATADAWHAHHACFARLALGCADPLPAVDWEGEQVIFAPEHPEQVCAGPESSDPIKIEYYLLDDFGNTQSFKAGRHDPLKPR